MSRRKRPVSAAVYAYVFPCPDLLIPQLYPSKAAACLCLFSFPFCLQPKAQGHRSDAMCDSWASGLHSTTHSTNGSGFFFLKASKEPGWFTMFLFFPLCGLSSEFEASTGNFFQGKVVNTSSKKKVARSNLHFHRIVMIIFMWKSINRVLSEHNHR